MGWSEWYVPKVISLSEIKDYQNKNVDALHLKTKTRNHRTNIFQKWSKYKSKDMREKHENIERNINGRMPLLSELPILCGLGDRKAKAKSSIALVARGRFLVLCLRTFFCRALLSFSCGLVEWLSSGPVLDDCTAPELWRTSLGFPVPLKNKFSQKLKLLIWQLSTGRELITVFIVYCWSWVYAQTRPYFRYRTAYARTLRIVIDLICRKPICTHKSSMYASMGFFLSWIW